LVIRLVIEFDWFDTRWFDDSLKSVVKLYTAAEIDCAICLKTIFITINIKYFITLQILNLSNINLIAQAVKTTTMMIPNIDV